VDVPDADSMSPMVLGTTPRTPALLQRVMVRGTVDMGATGLMAALTALEIGGLAPLVRQRLFARASGPASQPLPLPLPPH
jgi:hypothetical protein